MAQEESDICLALFVFANQLEDTFRTLKPWPRLTGGLQAATFAPAPETQVEEQAVSPEPSAAPVRHGMSFLECLFWNSTVVPAFYDRLFCRVLATSMARRVQ